jgi:hypothetical protein
VSDALCMTTRCLLWLHLTKQAGMIALAAQHAWCTTPQAVLFMQSHCNGLARCLSAMTHIVKELHMLLQHCLPGPWISTILLRVEAVRNVVGTGGACTVQDGAHCLEGVAREPALLDTGTLCGTRNMHSCIAIVQDVPLRHMWWLIARSLRCSTPSTLLLEAAQILGSPRIATCSTAVIATDLGWG